MFSSILDELLDDILTDWGHYGVKHHLYRWSSIRTFLQGRVIDHLKTVVIDYFIEEFSKKFLEDINDYNILTTEKK